MSVEVTLVVPCYKGAEHIRKCLESIRTQTLERSRFEVLVVINGEVDDSPRIIKDVFAHDAKMNYSILYEELASLSHARNVGIRYAKGTWVTWVDVDDWLSPNYLGELLRAAKSGVTPVAQVIDVQESNLQETSSVITEQILGLGPGTHDPIDLWRALGFAACKLLPTAQARLREFDLNLRSGEDVAYFAPFYSEHNLKIDNSPAHAGATYFRLVRAGSMSRQTANFNFSVAQRLAVMKHLDEAALTAEAGMRNLMHSMMRSQALFSKRYLDAHPESLEDVITEYDDASLNYTPWNMLGAKTGNLAILYNFLPYADASAVVAAKRILNSGSQWNVVNNDMSKIREVDGKLHEKVLPYISTQKTIRNPPVFGGWKGVRDFCISGLEAIREIESVHGSQSVVYSRSMWPASHYLAALHKGRNPGVSWTAEFSDPLRKDVLGHERVGKVEDDEVWAELQERLKANGFQIEATQSLFANCEKIAYALADRVIFTNPHQMSYMLSYLDDASLKRRARMVAAVEPQPPPGSRLLSASDKSADVGIQKKINLGLFGSFYPNRGAGKILRALMLLEKNELERVRLNVFSPNHIDLAREVGEYELEEVVQVNHPLPYLDYLRAAASMEYLIVADADTASTGHRLNPYLPSKLSDYRGTGAKIWALYEPGSVLSREHCDLKSRVDSVEDMLRALKAMVATQ